MDCQKLSEGIGILEIPSFSINFKPNTLDGRFYFILQEQQLNKADLKNFASFLTFTNEKKYKKY